MSEIGQQLHKAIDEIENEYQQKEYLLTDSQLNLLMEREEEYLKGKGESQTLDEFKAKMNKKYGL